MDDMITERPPLFKVVGPENILDDTFREELERAIDNEEVLDANTGEPVTPEDYEAGQAAILMTDLEAIADILDLVLDEVLVLGGEMVEEEMEDEIEDNEVDDGIPRIGEADMVGEISDMPKGKNTSRYIGE